MAKTLLHTIRGLWDILQLVVRRYVVKLRNYRNEFQQAEISGMVQSLMRAKKRSRCVSYCKRCESLDLDGVL